MSAQRPDVLTCEPASEETPRCQCPSQGVLNPEMAKMYDSVYELPFVNHEPGKCECTNGLQLYHRGEHVLWLCSNCHVSGDVPF